MNTRKAMPVIVTASLVVLLSGCAGAAGAGSTVRDDLGPAANAAVEAGQVRGDATVRDDVSPLSQRALSARARQELHAKQVEPAHGFSPEAIRELKSGSPQAQTVSAHGFSSEAIREMKAGAPAPVEDDLSPNGGRF